MNCFAHALPFLDDPYVAVGASLPDWLGAVDRKCRVREKNAAPLVSAADQTLAAVARGVVQHHRDDHWFHSGERFREFEMKFALELRERYDGERGLRCGFVAHVLIELFLDSFLQKRFPGRLDQYYSVVAAIDPKAVEHHVNQFATRPTTKLAPMIGRFVQERYVFDYLTDQGTMYRINRVLKRIGLKPMDDRIFEWTPSVRKRVYENAPALLSGLEMDLTDAS